jgi:leucyl aminopeptidase
MPVTCSVTVPAGAADSVGAYLAEVADQAPEEAGLVVVAVEADGRLPDDQRLESALGLAAHDVAAAYQLTGKPGQIAQTVIKAGSAVLRVAFLGVGDRSGGALRQAGGELGRMLRPGELAVTDVVAGRPADQVRAFTEGAILGSYRYSHKSDNGPAAVGEPRSAQLRMLGAAPAAAVRLADISAAAVAQARDLANTPSAIKSPEWLAGVAAQIAAGAGLRVRVWGEAELARDGFGGILAVGAGSSRPPRLIELGYEPGAAGKHVVLVGKGITFDSGGLSLKPNDAMKAMKTDMAGAAAIMAAMSALPELGVPHRVTALIAAAENLPSGSAYRPGDVITQYGGRSVEVLNTDAEGRLVLADALAYADARLDPDQIVDLATLTGAARVALGGRYAALYATDEQLATELLQAGADSGDPLWRMPLAADYAEALDSPVAELAHVPRAEGQPGSITAALFLRTFTGDRSWAHLDIAGAARSGADEGERTAGATGFGVRLLLRWLGNAVTQGA